jgi:hypothetical protein
MDNDLVKTFQRLSRQHPSDLERRRRAIPVEQDWRSSGLCPEAQADGVPCYEAGRSCDVCGRAGAELPGLPGRT